MTLLTIIGTLLLSAFIIWVFTDTYRNVDRYIEDTAGDKPVVSCPEEEYKAVLRDPLWRRRRQEILKRDKHRCQRCGSKHNLQVHHKYYNKYPDGSHVPVWDYPDKALVTLCDRCHKEAHDRHKMKSYYRSYKTHYVKYDT